MTDMYAADDYAAIAARMKAIKVESDPDTGLKPLCDLLTKIRREEINTNFHNYLPLGRVYDRNIHTSDCVLDENDNAIDWRPMLPPTKIEPRPANVLGKKGDTPDWVLAENAASERDWPEKVVDEFMNAYTDYVQNLYMPWHMAVLADDGDG